MAASTPSRALFEHTYPEELLLAVERGSGTLALELSDADLVAAEVALERALATAEDPLELELRPRSATTPEGARVLAAALLDVVEAALGRAPISTRGELRFRSRDEALLRSLVSEMRQRYVGDPPRAR